MLPSQSARRDHEGEREREREREAASGQVMKCRRLRALLLIVEHMPLPLPHIVTEPRPAHSADAVLRVCHFGLIGFTGADANGCLQKWESSAKCKS